MNYRKLELSVGAFVVAGLAAVAYLALKIGAGALMGADTYVVQARFANVAGLNAGANVAISGVTVGRVANITLNTENFGAIVDLEIRKDLMLSIDSIVSVKTRGLIGDKFLAIQPGVEDEIVQPGGMLTETESTVDIESLVSRMAFGGVDKEESE
jgi:phospholipid/cholesterol/gamma-HCH transport system substrate-binding protein